VPVRMDSACNRLALGHSGWLLCSRPPRSNRALWLRTPWRHNCASGADVLLPNFDVAADEVVALVEVVVMLILLGPGTPLFALEQHQPVMR
jgi:hypothetical protein